MTRTPSPLRGLTLIEVVLSITLLVTTTAVVLPLVVEGARAPEGMRVDELARVADALVGEVCDLRAGEHRAWGWRDVARRFADIGDRLGPRGPNVSARVIRTARAAMAPGAWVEFRAGPVRVHRWVRATEPGA